MVTKLLCLPLAALALIPVTDRAADDFAWGSTTGSSMIEIDATATSATLVGISYNGTTYYSFKLLAVPNGTLNGRPNNVPLGSSLWLAQNPNGTLYGLDNGGTLYTISTTLSTDQNGDIGFVATKVNVNSLGVNVTGAVWINSNLLDISTNQNLYQYNLANNALSNVGSFNNVGITGLAYNGLLYGVQFSPSPGGLDSISGVNLTPLAGTSSIGGLSQGSASFAGASLLYVSDGNSGFYSYSTTTNKLNTIINALGSGIHSLTPLSVSGGSGTPTPTPTATPTPTPTATPTPIPTPIVYNVPIIGTPSSLNVVAPETTTAAYPGPLPYPECAPGYTYTSTPTASFAAGAKIDPAGTLGVYRYYQTTTNGVNYSPATAASANPVSTVWAWSSGTTSTHTALTYTAGVVGTTGTPFFYGREILELEYLSGGVYTILDTKIIYQYPWNYNSSQTITPSVLFSNAVTGASDQAASNPSPYASPFPSPSPVFQGDPPRFTVAMNDLYPAGTTSVIIYSGTPVSNPTASGQQTVAITTTTTPNSGLWTTAPKISFEVAPYINTSATTAQTYTIAAVQTLPSAYPTSSINPAVLNTLTFTTTTGFNVNGTVGTVK